MKLFGYEILKANKPPKPDKSEQAGVARVSNLVYPSYGGTIEVVQPQDFDAQVAQYRSWVYVCSSKNSTSVANATLRLYLAKPAKGMKSILPTKAITKETYEHLRLKPGLTKTVTKAYEIEEILDHPILDLFSAVNATMNRFDLWENTELFLELTGNSYWFIVNNSFGIPGNIWVLPAQNMSVVPSKTEYISGYLYSKGFDKIPFNKEEIIHFRFPNPANAYYGLSPVAAAGSAISLNNSIRVSESALLKNNARPEGVLSSEDSLDETEFKRLKEEYRNYSGPSKVGKILLLERGLTYTPLTLSPRDMQYLQGRRMNLQEIAAIFGVPMTKIDPSEVRANNRAADAEYAKDTIEPRLTRIEEKLNEQLLPRYDPNLFVAYDSTVPEDSLFNLTKTESNLKTGYSSINQERQKNNEEPVPWGNTPWIPMGMQQVGSSLPPKKE
jgi:HK97 family phage portal protein